MSHLHEGTLLTVRDSALVEVSVQEHVAECAECQVALSDAQARAKAIASLLSGLDDPLDLEGAKAKVRARLDRGSLRTHSRFGSILRSSWGRAAALLLLAAGAVSALPGSPVRSWIVGTPSALEPTTATTGAAPAPYRSGVAVPTSQNGIRVVLTGAAPGAELEVLWGDGATARVSAPEGSAFSYGDGLLVAQLADGAVRVELPSSGPVSVEVDGQLYLRRTGDVVEVDGPLSVRSESGVLFTIPPR